MPHPKNTAKNRISEKIKMCKMSVILRIKRVPPTSFRGGEPDIDLMDGQGVIHGNPKTPLPDFPQSH